MVTFVFFIFGMLGYFGVAAFTFIFLLAVMIISIYKHHDK